MSLVMSQTQENVVSAGCPKRHDNVGFCHMSLHVGNSFELKHKKFIVATVPSVNLQFLMFDMLTFFFTQNTQH